MIGDGSLSHRPNADRERLFDELLRPLVSALHQLAHSQAQQVRPAMVLQMCSLGDVSIGFNLAIDDSAEVYALDKGQLRQLTRHNEEWMKEVQLGATRELSFRTKDGADVHGLLTLPPDYKEGQRYPLLLRIHGGPNGQDAHAFQFERHVFAANGYAVLQVNYRGSTGYGKKWQNASRYDMGGVDNDDCAAGVKYLIENNSEWIEQHFEFTQQISSQSNNLLELQEFCTNLIVQSPEKILKLKFFQKVKKNQMI
jgi:hypothetical protein